jgi:DNA polymerase III delta prime subunit
MENSNTQLEQEEKRIDALRKRQEKEMSKIIEREQTLATLQQKIKRSEEEEVRLHIDT